MTRQQTIEHATQPDWQRNRGNASLLVDKEHVMAGGLIKGPARTLGVAQIAKDAEALEVFYREHVDAVQRFIARRVHDPYLAADLTADVFLAAIDSAQNYRPDRGTPLAWLYGVARNVVAADRRRSDREHRARRRISGRILVEPDDLAELHERIDAEAEGRRLYIAMARLSESDRAVLELVALDGLAVRDAAEVLGVAAVTARVRLLRARRSLRKQLDPSAVEMNQQPSEASQ
jgi:RNA polymerase sigma factor (sigma-70 family)